jgi:PucR family transcriptional regulator, purine catabolism regulatory protein
VKLAEVRQATILRRAHLVAGEGGLAREIHRVHIVDMPDILPWVQPGQLLLTTGYAFPREEADGRALIRALAENNLAGIGLAVPRFFDHFPAAFCDEADRLDFPLLEIPWEIPFALITEELHKVILTEQAYVLEKSEQIHRSLTQAALEADNLQDIAHPLCQLLNRTVVFENAGGDLLGYAAVAGENQPEFSTEILHRHLKAAGLVNALDNASAAMQIPPVPEQDFPARLACPIRLKGELAGRVWILEGDTPLSDLDLRAAEHAALVAALQITHQRALASLEMRVGYSFLTSLLEGRFEATPQTLERARLQGFSVTMQYRVGMFILNDEIPLSREGVVRRETFVERLRDVLHSMKTTPLVSVSLNQIPFLLPEALDSTLLWERLREPGAGFGLSRAYSGFNGISQGYQELLAMLPHVHFGSFQRYEDLLLPRVLLGDAGARRVFLQETLGVIEQQKHGDMLVETVIAFARSGFHLRRTAEAMHLHPKSLHYRLEKVTELTGTDFESPEVRFRLQLAAQLLMLRD